ncbi:hypothetical protein KC660_00115, partial [Candidatus Dojkabacteria bacterium]|nr:hypothetical protein [Candidatus Dojkabacteria bacterium]
MDKRILVLFGVVMLALVSIPVALYSFDLFDVRKIFTGAETEVTPSNVYVTNLTESGVTVTWTTLGTPVEGQVKYGTTASGQL